MSDVKLVGLGSQVVANLGVVGQMALSEDSRTLLWVMGWVWMLRRAGWMGEGVSPRSGWDEHAAAPHCAPHRCRFGKNDASGCRANSLEQCWGWSMRKQQGSSVAAKPACC